MSAAENIRNLLREVPPHVRILAAAKTRTPEEISEAIEAGIYLIGENYVQEVEAVRPFVKHPAEWHCIGHLQTNKVRKAVRLFDVIETVDSLHLAAEIDKRCEALEIIMPVLIEVNSGREPGKAGVFPEAAETLVREVAALPRVRVNGLMTMGPLTGGPEELRRRFRETRQIFEHLKEACIPRAAMNELSMGMSDSWRMGIEEGATIIRVGSLIFGPRE